MFKNFTKRETIGTSLLFIIGLCSFGAWQSFTFSMTNSGISHIWWPMLSFSLLVIFFFLGTILWSNIFMRIVGAMLVFLPGLLFIRAWEYIAVGIVSTLCMYWSSILIAQEKKERTRFHFFKSVHTSSFLFIFGLSLLISSGYYVSLKNASWEELVPRFRISEEMTKVIFKIAGTVNPSFAQLSEGDMTIDEFLLSLEQNKQSDASLSQTSETEQTALNIYKEMCQSLNEKDATLSLCTQSEKAAQEVFLNGGRRQIASLVGRPVAGDEKISAVLSVALQNKLATFLSGEKVTKHVSSQAIPFFLALLLFLTLLSISSIAAPLYILGAQGFFFLLLWVGWLALSKVMVEQEQLVE